MAIKEVNNSSGYEGFLRALPIQQDAKTGRIRALVLEIIRRHIPITTLFTPELKVDLSVFIKDQMLMHRIAEFLLPLIGAGSIDSQLIAKHFENSELLAEIKAMFKQDPTPYLRSFYEACADVLNKKPPSSKSLKQAMEGRIFTIKNALIAQNTPEAILINQKQYEMTPQDTQSIKEEGAFFIREILRIHLLQKDESSSFREILISTARQLIPFVQKITRIYLRENGKSCPENPLTFRNPNGYNHHGRTAAMIMEVCLHALGYKTRLLGRADLEPKVTLATAHCVVEVTAPDNERYLIDPSYIQFHKDVCVDDSMLPTPSVLVLGENEIDKYIEDNLMVHWKANAELVKKGDVTTLEKLAERDQLIPFKIDRLGLPKEAIPSNVEMWVRRAFKRVWELSTYSPILSNRGFQEVFYGTGTEQKTYLYIKSMGLTSLSPQLSDEETEKRLSQLLNSSQLKGQNSSEALSLIAQLPTLKRTKYASLLDLDPRIKATTGIPVTLNAYFRSLKRAVNPEGKDKSVIYGCSGADCISVLLATDAGDFTFVDITHVPYEEFKDALSRLKVGDYSSIKDQLEQSDSFISMRSFWAGSSSTTSSEGIHQMNDLGLKLLFDLREAGVDLDKVVLTLLQDGVRIDFPWQYHGTASMRNRSLTFVTADITKPDSYPALLKTKLQEGFDIFYMKAAYFVPQYYPHFLPQIAKSVKEGGWLMTVDKTLTMEIFSPEECLDGKFELKKREETALLEELISPPFDPLSVIPVLTRFPNNRASRTPGGDLTYWSILSLRQKK